MISQKELLSTFSAVSRIFTNRFDEKNILTHTFSGEVGLNIISQNEIIFNEFIHWENESNLLINSRNIYRWGFCDSGNIKLEHLRFGKDHSVFLVELIQKGKDQWESKGPHNCNNDLYSATLRIETGKLILTWEVMSPSENYSLKTTYF